MAKSRWNKMSEEQKQCHLERERLRRKHLTEEQKQKRRDNGKKCQEKRRKNGKALKAESEYQRNGKGYFFKWANTIKTRAKKKNIPYDLDADFLMSIITTHCPVFGVKFERGIGFAKQFSPTIDRIIPEKGYIRDNVIIVSKRANQIKSDASLLEIQEVLDFYSKIL